MNTRHCCQTTNEARENARAPASRWRRGGSMAGWIVPGVTLILLPKCPLCVAMYLALFTGIGISVTSASYIRTSLLILCIAALLYLALMRLIRLAAARRHGQGS